MGEEAREGLAGNKACGLLQYSVATNAEAGSAAGSWKRAAFALAERWSFQGSL